MNPGLGLLIDFVKFAAPLVPGLAPVLVDFWGRNNLGPMPPDLAAWDAVDARIDAERKAAKGGL